jgi:ubiquitin carboxyl-terminal hydrolase 14
MQSGLKSSLQETIIMFSPTLNKDAQYEKVHKINRLPAYLAIRFVRFSYKDRVLTKILKDIKFTVSLDVYELCTPELQEKLNPLRHKFKEVEDKKLEESQKLKSKNDDQKDPSKEVKKYKHSYSFADDIGSNNSGYYELQAVLTHKGRSSSSGPNVAWIKRKQSIFHFYSIIFYFQCFKDLIQLILR